MVVCSRLEHSFPLRAASRLFPDSNSEFATLFTISRVAFISFSTSAKAGILPATWFDMSTNAPNCTARVCITIWATTIPSLKVVSVLRSSSMLVSFSDSISRENRLALLMSPLALLKSIGQSTKRELNQPKASNAPTEPRIIKFLFFIILAF